MSNNKLRVLVLGGGPSSEHEISLKTAEMVHENLDRKRYYPVLATITKDGKWLLPGSERLAKPKAQSVGLIADVVFIAMHGEFGEDGKVQAILESAGVPYTGSGVLASALGIDKAKSQAIFSSHGLKVPKSYFFSAPEFQKDKIKVLNTIKKDFSLPVVIKPTDRGSSVGVSIVKTAPVLAGAIKNAIKFSPNLMAQEFISGTELTCGVLDDGKNNLTPLSPTEIVPKMGEFFDYKSKYAESKRFSADEITPARAPANILKEAQNIALKTHVVIGCSGFSRTDMIWSRERNKIYTLEINTIPGLTAQSLLPKAAAVSGIPFPKLLDRIILAALQSQQKTRTSEFASARLD